MNQISGNKILTILDIKIEQLKKNKEQLKLKINNYNTILNM